MVQFNLLPDVKLKFIKAQRTKRLVMSISVIVTGSAIAILIVLLILVLWQKKSINDLNGNISKYSAQIKDTPNLNKILTIQNQLNSLPGIDAQKPVVTRLSGYLSKLTPVNVSYSEISLDFTQNKIDIKGRASDLKSVNQFVDILKFSKYTTQGNTPGNYAFSDVVLDSFSLNQKAKPGTPASGSTYEISAAFDPALFSSSGKVTLDVGAQFTTRSELSKPNNLFVGNNKSQAN